MKTSGLIITLHKDGSADLGFEDYNVDSLNQSDYECTFNLDSINFSKLLKVLNIQKDKAIKANLIKEFGPKFNTAKFEEYCKNNEIIFTKHIWIGCF